MQDNDRVESAAIVNNLTIKQKLPSNASIFTAEITAIDLALYVVSESEDDYFIIFSDSLSVLLSLHNMKVDNPLILKTLQKLHDLSCAHKILICVGSTVILAFVATKLLIWLLRILLIKISLLVMSPLHT